MHWLFLKEETLPELWERAVLECWNNGTPIKTEYDSSDDPPSRDSTATLVCLNPTKEPSIHKAFPGGLEELETYRQEVVNGVHDSWIDPASGKWSYTYHQRFTEYKENNQLDWCLEKLAEAPYTRRAQAITWQPDEDQSNPHCPCVQRVWFRCFHDTLGILKLHMHMHIRSNDAFKAGFMNMWAFIAIQKTMASLLSERIGEEVVVGPYTHIADSWHIYGSYMKEDDPMGFPGFLASVKKREFKDRVWNSTEPFVQAAFQSARNQLENKK